MTVDELIQKAIKELQGQVSIGDVVAHLSHRLAHTLVGIKAGIGVCELPNGEVNRFPVRELFDANTKLFDIIMDFADHFKSMTDEKASELITRSLKLDQEIVKIRQRYFKKFQKALPPSKC